jgi:hypothetical protein
MNWKGIGKANIRLEVLSKNTKNLSQDSRSLDRYLKPVPPEYGAGVLTTRPQRLVINVEVLTVKMSVPVFRVVTPSGLVGRDKGFEGTYYIHLQG